MSYAAILRQINKLSVADRLALLESISHTLREDLARPITSLAGLTPGQIRNLPREERQQILTASARLAVADYQPGGELTQFTQDLAGELALTLDIP